MIHTRLLVVDQAVGLWGAQRYLLRLHDPLAERGVELVLAAPWELALPKSWAAAGLPYRELALPLGRSVRSGGEHGRLSVSALIREGRAVRGVAQMIADAATAEGCNAIHANGHGVHLDAALAGRLAHLPVVLHLHEEMPQMFGRTLRATAVAIADASVAVSRAVAAGVPTPLRRKVAVIPNGVDVDRIRPGQSNPSVRASLGADAEEVLLVALTRIDPEKRIEDLFTALMPLRDTPGWHLAIAGQTSSYPGYELEVRDTAVRALAGRVTFAGPREDIQDILQAADLLVHAGVIEGMPLGLLEAQAAGLPVVAYRVAGVPEAVRHDVTGLLAPPRDTDELGRHMATLIADPSLRRQLGSAGRMHVERSHTLDRQAEAYAALLKQVTTTHPLRQAVKR